MNNMHVIYPYKTLLPWGDDDTFKCTWVFDDPRKGFLQEPFIAGVPEMIDLATAHIPDADLGFMLVFSAAPYPTGGTQLHILKKVAEELGGAWYRGKIDGRRMTGWLCPGLLKYFFAPPKEIFLSMHEKLPDPGPPKAGALIAAGERGKKERARQVRNLLYELVKT